MPNPRRTLAAITVAAASTVMLFGSATAQIPEPPSTIGGSVTDADGEVPEGLPVEAIVNDTVCGTSETVKTGDGDSRITAYVVDVHSARQTEGCGSEGDAVRIRIGERVSPSAVEWEQGWVEFDIVFGDTTPDAVPTFTPTPEGQEAPTSMPQNEATPGAGGNGGQGGGDDGSDDASGESGDDAEGGDGSDDDENGDEGDDNGASSDDEESNIGDDADEDGGVTGSTPAAAETGGGDGDGGFPVWAMVLLVVGGVAVVGGGVGYMMSRSGGSTADGASEDEDTVSGQ